MDVLACPNCGSKRHKAWYTEPVSYSGALLADADEAEFDFHQPGDIAEAGGVLQNYRCTDCEMVLVPFQVEGDSRRHVRALDEEDAQKLRLQSEEHLEAEHKREWQTYRELVKRIEERSLELIRRRVADRWPSVTHIMLEPSDSGGDYYVFYAALAVPEGETLSYKAHVIQDSDEMHDDDDLRDLISDYSIGGSSEAQVTLSIARNVAAKNAQRNGS